MIDLKVLRKVVEDAKSKGWYSTPLSPSTILALLDRLEAAESLTVATNREEDRT